MKILNFLIVSLNSKEDQFLAKIVTLLLKISILIIPLLILMEELFTNNQEFYY